MMLRWGVVCFNWDFFVTNVILLAFVSKLTWVPLLAFIKFRVFVVFIASKCVVSSLNQQSLFMLSLRYNLCCKCMFDFINFVLILILNRGYCFRANFFVFASKVAKVSCFNVATFNYSVLMCFRLFQSFVCAMLFVLRWRRHVKNGDPLKIKNALVFVHYVLVELGLPFLYLWFNLMCVVKLKFIHLVWIFGNLVWFFKMLQHRVLLKTIASSSCLIIWVRDEFLRLRNRLVGLINQVNSLELNWFVLCECSDFVFVLISMCLLFKRLVFKLLLFRNVVLFLSVLSWVLHVSGFFLNLFKVIISYTNVNLVGIFLEVFEFSELALDSLYRLGVFDIEFLTNLVI